MEIQIKGSNINNEDIMATLIENLRKLKNQGMRVGYVSIKMDVFNADGSLAHPDNVVQLIINNSI